MSRLGRKFTGNDRRRNILFRPLMESLERRQLMTVNSLQLLHASDLEGGVEAIEDAPNFAAVVEGLETQAAASNVPSVLISAGDNYIPGPFFNAAGDGSLRPFLRQTYEELFGLAPNSLDIREGSGRVDISVMNVIGFDASTIGNHEFDAGSNTFGDLIRTDIRGTDLDDIRWLGAQFPYLSANLDFSADGGLSSLFTSSILPHTDFQSLPGDPGAGSAPKLAPATTILVDDGLGNTDVIGVVAATTPLLESISSPSPTAVRQPGAGTNDMSDLAAILQPVINSLTGMGVNKIILSTHLQQLALEQSLLPLLSGVDIVIAGGSDTLLADGTDRLRAGDTPQGSYPVVATNADGDPALIVSTDGQYSYVGRLVVDFDASGVVIPASVNPGVSGVYATDSQGVTDVWGNLVDPFAPGTKGAQVRRLTEAVQQVVTEKDSQVFGNTSVFLEGRRARVRTEETNLGNLTADANLAAARELDPTVAVSIKNGGGIRSEIGAIDGLTGELLPTQANPQSGKQEGEVSQLDIENALRFNNSLSLLTLTAEELAEVIEHGVAASRPGATPGQFPQVGGIAFSFDPRRPSGDRVQSLAIVDDTGSVLDTIVQQGQVVGDPHREIRVVTLSFLAGGGDNYPFPSRDRLDTGIGEQQALAEFLSKNYAGSPFASPETPAFADTRIQNLVVRGDTVLTPQQIYLAPIGTHATGIFDGSAAEIVAHDPASQRLFYTNAELSEVGILDIADPTNPTLIGTIDVSTLPVVGATGGPNSVAVANGLVAIAVEADTVTDPGFVAFYTTSGSYISHVTVGALPDSLTFTPDGNTIVVSNEGEPDGGVNPMGSVSLIDVSSGPLAAVVSHVDFTAFDGREEELRNKGVRVFPGVPASLDLEPEYGTVSPDGTTAFITLQEANAFAVIDIASASLIDIQPLGVKDHLAGTPRVSTYDFTDLPDLGTTATGEVIKLGGFSGLWFDGMTSDGKYRFLAVPDRGPNGDETNGQRPFLLPEYQARIHEFTLDPATGEIELTQTTPLTRNGGSTPISGLPNLVGVDEVPVDAAGNPINLPHAPGGYDPFGADLEGIVRDPNDGTFWMVDEYRPAIYHFGTDGVLIDRYIPQGTAGQVGDPAGTYGSETLPADYLTRRGNRGFEAVAYDTDQNLVYAFIQTPLSNPNRATGNASKIIRMLAIDPADGTPVAEYVYALEKPVLGGNVDKMGDAVYVGNGRFRTVERDSGTDPTDHQYVFEIDLLGATNVLGMSFPGGETLEQLSVDDLVALGVQPVAKRKITNLPSIGYQPTDKTEGLALLPGGRLAVLNDNDFGIVPGLTSIQLGIVSFDPAGIDASDRDDRIHIRPYPVFGMYMPDAISSFEVGGQTFYVTANEGDARDADDRVRNLTLDPTAFPNAAELQQNEVLGRLEVSTIDGDLDGDGDFDQLYAYGSRSFTIWDANGNLVFDSGEDFEQFTAARLPAYFNSTNDETDFDSRSDAKGPEPEAVTTGVIDGRTYVFVGLERIGGIMVYDVSDPSNPNFVQYLNNRDFEADPETAEAGDLGVEDLKFISAADSPNGVPLVVASNEVSGTVTIFQVYGTTPTIQTDASGGDLTVVLSGDHLQVISNTSGQTLLDQPLQSVHSLAINGRDLVPDVLTIDFSGGEFTIPGGIAFDGGSGGFGSTRADTLNFLGTSGDDRVTIGADELALNGLSVWYSEVEFLEVDLGGGDDTVSIEATEARATLHDSDGTDTLDFSNADQGVRVHLRLDRGQLQSTGVARLGLDGTFEHVIGSAYDDRIYGNDANNVVLGGGGDDFVNGYRGENVLVGGDGDDYLIGGRDRDILIGGLGRDRLFGLTGSDLLVGGSTDHDANRAALLAIQAEWISGNLFATRVANLESGTGANSPFRLQQDETTEDDAARDLLFGGSGQDWLIRDPGDLGI